MDIVIGFVMAVVALLLIAILLAQIVVIRELKLVISYIDNNIKATSLLGTEWVKFTVGMHQALKAAEQNKREWNERLT